MTKPTQSFLTLLAVVSFPLFPLRAQTITWTGTAGDGLWLSGGNWSGGVAPIAGQDAVLGAASPAAIRLNNNGAGITLGSLTFTAAAPAVTLTLDPVNFLAFSHSSGSGAGIVNQSSSTQTLINAGGSDAVTNTQGGQITFDGVTSGNLNIVTQGKTTTDTGVGGSLTLFRHGADAGTSTLGVDAGVATFSGGYGQVQFLENSSAASSTIAITGGDVYFFDTSTAGHSTIQVNASATTGIFGSLTFDNSSTAGNTSISGTGVVYFLGNSTAGNATLTGGSVRFYNTSSGGNARVITVSGKTLEIGNQTAGGISIGSLEGNGSVSLGTNTLTVGSLNTDAVFSGGISDTGGMLTKNGTGTLTLAGTNTYTGATTINAGTIQLGNGGAAGTVAGNITNNASLVVNRSDVFSFAKIISGTGTLTQSGAGTTALTATNTYTGATIITGGILKPSTIKAGGTASALGQSTNAASNLVIAGGTLQYASSTTATDRLFTIGAGGATIDASGSSSNTLTFNNTSSLAFSGTGARTLTLTGTNTSTNTLASLIADNGADATSLVKNGIGKWVLSGANTFTGGTTVNTGTLALSGSGAIAGGPVTLNGGALDLGAGTKTVGALTLAGGTLQNGTVSAASVSAQSGTISANISGTGGTLNKTGSGTLTLSGVNTFSSDVTISDGTLRATTSASALGSGALILAGGTLSLGSNTATAFNRNTSVTASSTIVSDRTSNGAGVTHTLGTLSLGAATLNVTHSSFLTSGTAGLTFGATTLTDNATLAPDTSTLVTLASVASTDKNFTVNGAGNLTVTNALSLGAGTLEKSGAGVLTLSGPASYGATIVDGGTLTLGAGADLGTGALTMNGGSLSYTNAAGLGARDVTLNGGLLSFTTASIAGTGALTINGGGLQWGSGTTLDLSGRFTLAGDATFDTNGNNVSFGNVVTSPGGLTKAGAGNLTLTSGSSFPGPMIISGGTLVADGNIVTGASSLTMGGGNLTSTFNADTPTSRSVTVSGIGTLTLDRTSAGPAITLGFGALTLGNGTLALAKTANITSGTPALTFGAATLTAVTKIAPAAGTAITLASAALGSNGIQMNGDGVMTIAGTITGSGSTGLTLNSGTAHSGTLMLSASDSTYTSSTTVNNGTLVVTKLADLGQPSSLGAPTTLSGGRIGLGFGTAGVLRYIGDTDSTTNRTIQLAGNAGIASVLESSGIGTVTFTSAVVLLNNTVSRTLTLNGTNTGLNTISGAIPNPTTVPNATSVTKSGPGTWMLSGTSNYNGGTTVTSGTLVVGADAALGTGTVSFSGGTLQGDGTARTLANTLSLSASSTIGGSSDLTFNGALTTVTSATLSIANSGSTTFGAIALTNDATPRTLTFNPITGATIAGVISNGPGIGSLTKIGDGSLTLSATESYTGPTNVGAGSLVVNGSLGNTAVSVASGATLAGSGTINGATTLASGAHLVPGNSPGTLTFTNSLSLTTGAILDFQLGITSDLIRVTGGTLASHSGIILNLSDAGGFHAGTAYTLFDFSTGTINATNFLATDFTLGSTLSGYTYNLALTGSTLQLTASAIPEPATYAAMFGVAALGLAALRRRRV